MFTHWLCKHCAYIVVHIFKNPFLEIKVYIHWLLLIFHSWWLAHIFIAIDKLNLKKIYHTSPLELNERMVAGRTVCHQLWWRRLQEKNKFLKMGGRHWNFSFRHVEFVPKIFPQTDIEEMNIMFLNQIQFISSLLIQLFTQK